MELDTSESSLRAKSEWGAILRAWKNDDIGRRMIKEMEEISGKLNKKWLLVSDEDAKKLRDEAKPLAAFMSYVDRKILEGAVASQALQAKANALSSMTPLDQGESQGQ